MNVRCLGLALLAFAGLPSTNCPKVLAEPPAMPRYVALRASGELVEGQALSDWHATATDPQLDGATLLASDPIRWLRDRRIGPPTSRPSAYVELFGGDLLPGRVREWRAGDASAAEPVPAHLLVDPTEPLSPPQTPAAGAIRVLPAFVRRIVREQGDRLYRPYEPGTLFYRDGRQLPFRAVRFHDTGIEVLGTSGRVRARWDELAEVHLADRDCWSTYLDELALLNPTAEDAMLQWETTTGSRLTSCARTFRADSDRSPADPSGWIHGLQPAWSLDTVWVRHESIWLRHRWEPHQLPLSRLAPLPASDPNAKPPAALPAEGSGASSRDAASRPAVEAARTLPSSPGTGGGTWRVDRNVLGRPLHSGGRFYGWGLGVQAESWLAWQLPAAATAFSTRVGLDRAAGNGGCIRPRILWGNPARPLYEGPVLVGSDRVEETGRLKLPSTDAPSADSRRLLLHVSMAHADRPPGADPLNLRDLSDWLEPVVELDRERLRREIRERLQASKGE